MPQPAPPPAIEFIGVHKSFRGEKILDGIDLTIPQGKTTVIIGRSGGGRALRSNT